MAGAASGINVAVVEQSRAKGARVALCNVSGIGRDVRLPRDISRLDIQRRHPKTLVGAFKDETTVSLLKG